MDAALDSPLEALAINYLAYGFLTAVNNIWPWIAVLTAAVSFWRMRALPSTPQLRSSTTHSPPEREITAAEEEEEEEQETASTTTTELSAAPAKATCRVLEREGSTKMKFSLYYKEEVEEEVFLEEDGGDDDESGGDGEAVRMEARRGDWEGVVGMRMGDMGLYRWQDRRVLDGNVVRLWGRKHAAAVAVEGGVVW